MERIYKAHINEQTKEIQTVKEHSENTAGLCAGFAIPPLKDILYVMGLFHDLGKYQKSFQKRIDGENIRIEHSICGAMAAKEHYPDPLGLMMGYCIAGHHTGIPDGGFTNDTEDMQTLCGRLVRETENFDIYKEELSIPTLDQQGFIQFLMKDCGKDLTLLVDKFAFLTRFCFSCLTDADSLDTAKFCNGDLERPLQVDFQACLETIDTRLASFECQTRLQSARACLQQQVFEKVQEDAEIYLMNMPTGSGKTLCSAKFALERAVGRKKRIIYIIPYNSIIDQTSDVFERLFGEHAEILRHQSTFSYEDAEDRDEDYRRAAKNATENWDAPFIITTAVQFFQSIYGNKRGKLRKLHNMADSVLILDEAHMMPLAYLQPCLRAIAFITRYLNSEAVFLTATMPDFPRLIEQYALPDSKICQLITDTSLFAEFKKCTYQFLGETGVEGLLTKAKEYPSSLFIVNKRAVARQLYQTCTGKKYHLSTYMTAYERKRLIREIRRELRGLEEDFPDPQHVPEDRRITIISTSLIEAGVDLDVYTVFRELAGLDNILQAGGRCNREGKRSDADVYIFEMESERNMPSLDERGSIVKGMLKKYRDISCQESITEYYDRFYAMKKEEIQMHTITRDHKNIQSIPFREYAEKFELIDQKTVSIVVPEDEKSCKMIETLRYTGAGMGRELQSYVCSIHPWELDDLIRQHVVEDFGKGIHCLMNPDYYDRDTGILFEAKDYWI